MGIRIFITSVSANSMLKKHQQTIIDTLQAKSIDFELVDISLAENEEQKLYMREKAKAKEGQVNAMPPQIFFDDEYLGDYDAFDMANEEENLDVFLRLAGATQTSQATLNVSSASLRVTARLHSKQPPSAGNTNGIERDANENLEKNGAVSIDDENTENEDPAARNKDLQEPLTENVADIRGEGFDI